MVHAISSLVLPCSWRTERGLPLRSRNRRIANTSASVTNTKTTAAIQITIQNSESTLAAVGPAGFREFCGTSPPTTRPRLVGSSPAHATRARVKRKSVTTDRRRSFNFRSATNAPDLRSSGDDATHAGTALPNQCFGQLRGVEHAFEPGDDDPVSIDDEDPRFGRETPLGDRGTVARFSGSSRLLNTSTWRKFTSG